MTPDALPLRRARVRPVHRVAFPRLLGDRREDLIALSLLLLLCLIVALIQMPFSVARVDTLTFYMPMYSELGRSLRGLDIPGWSPAIMSGAPFAGDPQSGWGYIPAMVIFTLFPSLTGFKIFILAHVFFAGTATFLYVRNLGIRPFGAFAAGLVFCMGNFMERTACCTIHVQVAVWIPFVFLCIDRSQLAQTWRQRGGWLLAAGFGCSQIVAGWVGQGAYYGGLAVAIYVLYRFLISPRRDVSWNRRVRSLVLSGAVMAAIAGSLAATAVFPRLEVIDRSNLATLYERGAGVPDLAAWHFPVFVERLVGPLGRLGRWYFGSATLAAALITVLFMRGRRDVYFFAAYALFFVSLVISGSPTLRLVNHLPEFRSLHAHSPSHIYIVVYIALAVLVGYLIDALTDVSWRPLSVVWRLFTLEAPLALIVAALIYVQYQRSHWVPASHVLFVVLACTAIGVATVRGRPEFARLGAAALIIVIFIDPAGQRVVSQLRDDSGKAAAEQLVDQYQDTGGAAGWLLAQQATEGPFRFFGYDLGLVTDGKERETYVGAHWQLKNGPLLLNNRAISLGLEDIQGYNPVQINRYVTFLRNLNGQSQSYHTASVLEGGIDSPLLNLLNARYIVVPALVPPGRPDLLHLAQHYPTVYRDATVRILENRATLPRAWIVHRAERTRTRLILEGFSSASVDPREVALLDTNAPALDVNTSGAPESVQFLARENDEIRLHVSASGRGMVILGEMWDPRWVAAVDGVPARVYRADYMLRGIVVGPGEHEIALRYSTRNIKMTMLSWAIPPAAALFLVLATAVDRRKRDRGMLLAHP